MKIVIVTDAWHPQVNGVITTLEATGDCLRRDGHEVHYITPEPFIKVPCPTYPEIRLSILPARRVRRMLDALAPDNIHIATEGPLGLAARRYCLRRGFAFTSSYHTRFPQYVRARFPIPLSWSYAYMRWFHGAAARTMVGTRTQKDDLDQHGFRNIVIWPRGVDTTRFAPGDKDYLRGTRPISMYMGRVSVEKNLEAFLEAEVPGTKYVVGDGPALGRLRHTYRDAVFTGYRFGEELRRTLAAADVFVFPSRTDTLGLVIMEANACGVPAAAFPVMGPKDLIVPGVNGHLSEDLAEAIRAALEVDPATCREVALEYSWERFSRIFLSHLAYQPGRAGALALA